ncbi:hypothetical protein ACTA71_009426 [Dictyostelium dimigraforme]
MGQVEIKDQFDVSIGINRIAISGEESHLQCQCDNNSIKIISKCLKISIVPLVEQPQPQIKTIYASILQPILQPIPLPIYLNNFLTTPPSYNTSIFYNNNSHHSYNNNQQSVIIVVKWSL